MTTPPDAPSRFVSVDENAIRTLVYAFYDRVRADALLGPVFERALHGKWDEHLPKMCDFWAGIALGAKTYRGNVQQAHRPLEGLEPAHFNRWLYLFLDTAESLFEPAAARVFMEAALRIAQSLQFSRFGWDYKIPAEQQALLDAVAPRRDRRDGEPFPVRIVSS